MIALVDCNNFYVSCERLFQPELAHKPVIVLSNNDGCAIARSEEAKSLGINMGTPAFMIDEKIKRQLTIFSSNYTLYGDISARVMKILSWFAPKMEVYSIDEAFLDLSHVDVTCLAETAEKIRQTIKQLVAIPVTVGIAPTKTLAKMANRYAKKLYPHIGFFYAANSCAIDEILQYTAVENIWGVGRQYTLLLKRNGFKTAYDIKNAPGEWIRKNMTVQGQRLLAELNGQPSKEWEHELKPKKNICTSRSFGSLLTDKSLIKEAVVNYASSCALKLRNEKTCAQAIIIFLQTNPHKQDEKQYYKSVKVKIDQPTNDTASIIRYALVGFDIVFEEGYRYMKCGVIVIDLIPAAAIQLDLLGSAATTKIGKLMSTLDEVNEEFGKDKLRYAAQGFDKKYKLRAAHLSRKYTTRMSDVIEIKH